MRWVRLVSTFLFFSGHVAYASKVLTNFVWKNPSECQLDSIGRAVLAGEAQAGNFKKFNDFWQKNIVCGEDRKSILKKEYLYQVKWGLLSELKRSLNEASKETSNFQYVLHDKRFQRFILLELERIYSIGLRHRMTNFEGMLNSNRVIAHIDSGHYSKFSKKDIRRLVEFHVNRSAASKTFDGNQWGQGAYGSAIRVMRGVGVVTRVSWGLEGNPAFEPRHANDEIQMTAEVGLTTLGSDRIAAEILGVQMASNHGKPEQLIVLNINWTPESQSDFQLSLTSWYGLDTQQSDEGDDLGNELFVGISGSYKFEVHPFEPIVRFFKRLKIKKNN